MLCAMFHHLFPLHVYYTYFSDYHLHPSAFCCYTVLLLYIFTYYVPSWCPVSGTSCMYGRSISFCSWHMLCEMHGHNKQKASNSNGSQLCQKMYCNDSVLSYSKLRQQKHGMFCAENNFHLKEDNEKFICSLAYFYVSH